MATAAAAVVAKARRNVISHFMQANAVSAATAVAYAPDRRLERRMVERFVGRGVLVQTGADTYFLDLPAYDRWRRSVRKRAALLMGGVVAIGAVLAALA